MGLSIVEDAVRLTCMAPSPSLGRIVWTPGIGGQRLWASNRVGFEGNC